MLQVRGESGKVLAIFSNFYNINTNVEISTKKKGTQSENEDGTNSFGVHI